MGFDDVGTSKTVDFLTFCSNITISVHMGSNSKTIPSTPLEEEIPWFNISNTGECRTKFFEFKEKLTSYEFDINQTRETVFSLHKKLQKNYGIFTNMSFVTDEQERACLSAREYGVSKTEPFLTVYDLFFNVIRSKNFAEALSYAEQIALLYETVFTPFSTYEQIKIKLREACQWADIRYRFLAPLPGTFEKTLNQANEFWDEVWAVTSPLRLKIISQQKLINDTVILEIIDKYLEKNMTKLELLEALMTLDFEKRIRLIHNMNKEIKELIERFLRQLFLYVRKLVDANDGILSNDPVPVLNQSDMYHLQLFKEASDTHDQDMQLYVSQVKPSTFWISNVLQRVYDIINEGPVEKLRNTITRPVDEMLQGMTALNRNLKQFQESTVMDNAFFL